MISISGGFFIPAQATEDLTFEFRSKAVAGVYKKEKLSATVEVETRFPNDARRLTYYAFVPRVRYALHPNLNLQLNYSFLNVRSGTAKHYSRFHQIEPEINPHFKIGDKLRVNFRNRIEFRHIEDRGYNNTRYRGRVRLTYPLEENPILRSVFADSEFYYNFRGPNHFSSYTPRIGVFLRDIGKARVMLYYRVRHSKRADGEWNASHLYGATVVMRF